jgi:hypothetical protein
LKPFDSYYYYGFPLLRFSQCAGACVPLCSNSCPEVGSNVPERGLVRPCGARAVVTSRVLALSRPIVVFRPLRFVPVATFCPVRYCMDRGMPDCRVFSRLVAHQSESPSAFPLLIIRMVDNCRLHSSPDVYSHCMAAFDFLVGKGLHGAILTCSDMIVQLASQRREELVSGAPASTATDRVFDSKFQEIEGMSVFVEHGLKIAAELRLKWILKWKGNFSNLTSISEVRWPGWCSPSAFRCSVARMFRNRACSSCLCC